MLSNYLAEIWGISIVVISLAFLVRGDHLRRLFTKMETEDHFFLWGLTIFLIGLAMVLAHNVWTKDWRVVITIFGWLSLLKGLGLLFFPEMFKKWTKKVETSPSLPFLLIILLIIGLAITYFGFTA